MKRKNLLVLCLIALVTSACGIPTSSQPDVVSKHNVPFHLLSPDSSSTTTTTEPALAYAQENIFLLDNAGKAISVRRDVSVPATLTAVLTALIAGPTSAEASQGITSALPSDLKVISIALVGSTVTLNFNTAFGKINGAAETQAVGQVVLTTTDQPQISAVSFQIDSKPISVPTSSGVVTSAPVTAAQYVSLKN